MFFNFLLWNVVWSVGSFQAKLAYRNISYERRQRASELAFTVYTLVFRDGAFLSVPFIRMNDDFSLTSLSLVVKLHPCLEASPDGRPLTEKQRCSGSYRRAVSFQVFKDDSISQRPSLRRLRSRSTVHARRNLPVKEFCYLRTVNLTAAMCRQVNGKVQDST